MTIPPSLIEQAIYMINTLDIDPNKPSAHQYGMLVSNLAMLKMNAKYDRDAWEHLLYHLMYPTEPLNPSVQAMFIAPLSEMRHYQLALKVVDDIYNQFGE